ncbi:MAG: histidinol-phosphate transaminase [Salinivirgaceae bacterium]
MSSSLFSSKLRKTSSYSTNLKTLLNKNEQSCDTSPKVKRAVLESLKSRSWNRYPEAESSLLNELVAAYAGVAADQIALGAGAASLLGNLLNYFAINGWQIVFPEPSYAFFNHHCKAYNIPYISWVLNHELQYDIENLPELTEKTVLFIVSPNNPVGNTIPEDKLRFLLKKYPKTRIILDAVYQEYGKNNFTPLINEYEDLLVLRSFSKAFPAAGLRLGYLCGQARVISQYKKLVLPYSINHFSQSYAKKLLSTPDLLKTELLNIEKTLNLRKQIYEKLLNEFDASQLRVFPSEGNFLLLQFTSAAAFNKAVLELNSCNVEVLNTSNHKELEYSIRVSIGSENEMKLFYQCIKQTFKNGTNDDH